MRTRNIVAKAWKEVGILQSLKQSKAAKAIPTDWESFASQTTIRSSNGFQKFTPYPYQLRVSNLIDNHNTTVIGKTRQTGLSELAVSKIIHWSLLQPGFTSCIFSKTQVDASLLAKRARLAIEGLPDEWGVKLVSDSLTTLELMNGSTLFFKSSKIDSARGINSVNALLFDEAAFVPEIKLLYEATLPCTAMVTNPKVIIISTPNTAQEEEFYFSQLSSDNGFDVVELAEAITGDDVYNDLLVAYEKVNISDEPMADIESGYCDWTDTSGYGKALIHYSAHPIYGDAEKYPDYLEHVRKAFKMSESTLQREFNLSFKNGASTLISPALVDEVCVGDLTKKVKKPSVERYFIAVDPAFSGANSKKSDYFAATVIGVNKKGEYQLVDMYANRTRSISEHVFEIAKLCKKYNKDGALARIAVESNGGGAYVLENLDSILNRGFDRFDIIPLTSTQSAKAKMVNNFLYSLETGRLTLADDRLLISQLLAFSQEGNKYEASPGNHDDLVSALYLNVENIKSYGYVEFGEPKQKELPVGVKL